MASTDPQLSAEEHRRVGVAFFNATWDLLEQPARDLAADDRMLHLAHASRLHWELSGAPAQNLARGEWQCSRVYAVLGRAEPALHHAGRCLAICEAGGIGDWDLAFAYEALARASAVARDGDATRLWLDRAEAAAASVTTDEERALVLADLATIEVPSS